MLGERLARDRAEAGDQVEDPGGSPAASVASAKSWAVSGVSSAGLRTTVQPAASAGATLATIWWSG